MTLALVVAPVAAQVDFDTALATYQAGDHAAATAQFAALARAGDARGQFAMGLVHEQGTGVPRDLEQAVSWYAKSAAQGFASAQFNLGVLCERGLCEGVAPADPAHWFGLAARRGIPGALAKYRDAAADGDVVAQYRLAMMYLGGWGVPRDRFAAAKWLKRAAEAGDARAQQAYGFLCEAGVGSCAGATAALRWYRAAARQGDEAARFNYARLVMGLPAPGEPELAEAIAYLERLADDHADAALLLGLVYTEGRLLGRDAERAVTHYTTAARLGNAQAANNLAILFYEQGDHVTALAWMTIAADAGSEAAAANLERVDRGSLSDTDWARVATLARELVPEV